MQSWKPRSSRTGDVADSHLTRDATNPGWQRFLEEMRAFLPGTVMANTVFAKFSPRERELVELVAQGGDNAQLAATYDLREKTVRNHITSIFTKLEVDNRAQAIVLARQAGFGVQK